MAFIKPFRGVRPRKDLAEKVASLPYDVMNVEEARRMAEGNRYSFLHVSRPEIDLPSEVDPYDQRVHQRGRENLQGLMREGVLLQDAEEHYYIYRQKMGKVTQTGLVACSGVDDYDSGVIRKHELTRADKEEDRIRHIDCLDANDEPVFYTFRSTGEVKELLAALTREEPEYDFTTGDGVSHTFWVVRDTAAISRLTALFAATETLYVADGHHRSAAASRVRELRRRAGGSGGEYDSFLTVIFPHDEMNIMAYNRVVKDLNGMDAAAFLSRLGERFEVRRVAEAYVPQRPHLFGMYLEGLWYELTPQAELVDESDPVKRLDVTILQESLLQPLLSVGNPRTDKRIDFVGGIRGVAELERLVDQGLHKVAFSLHPTSIEDLMALADAGEIMPPKSTWFEPKLRSGLVIHLLT
ncbi:MAG TPA: DUF1015 family protein [Verrucomicrobiae bacterium]|nr:DUF1015 family protein [Verrucomicrobiae bacterium]